MRTPLNPSVQNLVFPLQMVIDCEWISQCLYFLKINRFLTCLWMFKSHCTRFFFVSCQVRVWAFRTTSVRWWHPDVFSFHVISHLHTMTIHNCTKFYWDFPSILTGILPWQVQPLHLFGPRDAQKDDLTSTHSAESGGPMEGVLDGRGVEWRMIPWSPWFPNNSLGFNGSMTSLGKNGIWEGSNGIYIMAKTMVTNSESMTIMNT